MGRSSETHCMRNKPIKEGSKFFNLCTYQGVFINFTPHGRAAAEQGRQEYAVKKFREKQDGRMVKKGIQSVEEERKDYMQMDKFCLAIGNYFTLPDIISSLRQKDIGVVGTARMRK
eukprot:3555669-Ditylum_brightwellii.AAC.1